MKIHKKLSSRFLMSGIIILIVGLLAFQMFIFRNAAADDAYITYRYAFQLEKGQGFTYNTNEQPVEGTSSLLWAILLAVPGKIFDYLYITRAINFIALIGFILVYLWRIKKIISKFNLILIPLLILLSPIVTLLLMPAIGVHLNAGMETLTSSILCTIGVIIVASSKYRWWMGVFAIILFLTRPDAPLPFFVAILISTALQRPRLRETILIISLPLISVAIVWAIKYAYFGNLFPLPFYMKATGSALLPGIGVVMETVLDRYFWFLVPISVAIILGERQERLRLLIIVGAIIASLLYLCRVTFVINFYDRFFWNLGIVPIIIYGCLESLIIIITKIKLNQNKLLLVIALFALSYPIWIGSLFITDLYWNKLDKFEAFGRPNLEHAHGEINTFLADTYVNNKNLTALIWDAGRITLKSPWQFIDGYGLNTPYVALFQGDPTKLASIHLQHSPDLIIFNSRSRSGLQVWGKAAIEVRKQIGNQYTHILSFEMRAVSDSDSVNPSDGYYLQVFSLRKFAQENAEIIDSYVKAGYQPISDDIE